MKSVKPKAMEGQRAILRPHAPLMWLTTALIAGYSLAEAAAPAVASQLGVLIVTGLLLGLGAWALRDKSARWKLYGWLAVVLLAAASYHIRTPRTQVALQDLAPREATIVIEPLQSFALRAESGREAGLGIIREGALAGQKINYSVRWKLPEPLVLGSWVQMEGVLAPNPRGGKGFEEYLERSHVTWSLSRGQALEIAKPAPRPRQWIAQLREGAVEVLERRWQQAPSNGLLPAMVMGQKAELTRQQKENLTRSGTMHLVAVSGLNVMAVAAVLWGLWRLTGLPRGLQALGVVALLGIYALVAGGGASVVRAWGMVALGMAAWGLRRQLNLWAIVVMAATLSLLIEPLSFLHAGWRLSFGVVAGIILGMSAIERTRVLDKLPRMPRAWAQTLALSAVAGLSVAPMTAAYWGLAQPLGWALNALVISLASLVTILGTISWTVAWLPGGSATINELAYGLLGIIDWLINGYLQLPGAVVQVPQAQAAGVEIWGTLIVLGSFYAAARWGGAKKFAARVTIR